MKKTLFACLVLIVFAGAVFAQKEKTWTEWSKKDAEKILNDSSWGQTFTDTGSEPVSTSAVTNSRGGFAGERQGESGEGKPSRALNYRVRFLTAKPVREAFARLIVLNQPNASADLKTQLQGFVDRDFGDYLVVSFSIDGADERMSKMAMMGLTKLTAEMVKEKVYLERKDGKRATFIDYKAPLEDGMGGKFVFSRTLDGQPFLSDSSEAVKFFVQISEKQKITMKFKVTEMTYGGKLEY